MHIHGNSKHDSQIAKIQFHRKCLIPDRSQLEHITTQ